MNPITILDKAVRQALTDVNMTATTSYVAATILNHATWHIMHPELMQRPEGFRDSAVSEIRFGVDNA